MVRGGAYFQLLGITGRRLKRAIHAIAQVSCTCYSSRIEVELKNAAKKYRSEELHNQEKQITAKSKFRDDSLMAKQNSST